MTNNKYKTVAILQNTEEAIKYCSATLKLKVFLTQGVPPTLVILVLGFCNHFCLPKGFRKEKKVEKHCNTCYEICTILKATSYIFVVR